MPPSLTAHTPNGTNADEFAIGVIIIFFNRKFGIVYILFPILEYDRDNAKSMTFSTNKIKKFTTDSNQFQHVL